MDAFITVKYYLTISCIYLVGTYLHICMYSCACRLEAAYGARETKSWELGGGPNVCSMESPVISSFLDLLHLPN